MINMINKILLDWRRKVCLVASQLALKKIYMSYELLKAYRKLVNNKINNHVPTSSFIKCIHLVTLALDFFKEQNVTNIVYLFDS